MSVNCGISPISTGGFGSDGLDPPEPPPMENGEVVLVEVPPSISIPILRHKNTRSGDFFDKTIGGPVTTDFPSTLLLSCVILLLYHLVDYNDRHVISVSSPSLNVCLTFVTINFCVPSKP